jgi:transcriptional regulator with XRE-family HTH domain
MSFGIDRTILPILAEAQNRLGMSQRGLAELTGVSRRTILRWYSNRALPIAAHVTPVIEALYPQHRDVAVKLAHKLGHTLVTLGVAPAEPPGKAAPPSEPAPPAPPPPLAPAPRAFPPADLLIDSIICAAAEALSTTPAAVRPVVQAAFARARGLGVSVQEVDDALSPRPVDAAASPAKSSASSSRKSR